MNQIEVFQQAIDRAGPVAPIALGPNAGLLVADPACIHHVLKSASYGKGAAWQPMRRLLFPQSGALSANDDLASWRRFRAPVTRSLAREAIQRLVEPMAAVVDATLSEWPVDVPFELSAACARIVQKLFVLVFFGSGISEEDSERVGTALVAVLRLIASEQHGGAMQEAVEEETAALRHVLQRLVQGSSRGIVASLTELDPVAGSEILLNLFLAGYESASLALGWTLSLIAAHPEVEQRLLTEMERHGPEAKPTLDTLQQWPELGAALDEGMRLYTPLWALPREAFVADTLPSGHPVAAGTIVMLSVLHMHRLPSIWGDDAAAFRPERFLDPATNPAARDSRVFLPFGAGMRICPAELLSRAEMMICVHRILHRFSMRLLTPPQWEPAFTLRPLNGISVMLSPRC